MIKSDMNNNGVEKTIQEICDDFGISQAEAEEMREVLRMNLQATGIDIRDIQTCPLGRE